MNVQQFRFSPLSTLEKWVRLSRQLSVNCMAPSKSTVTPLGEGNALNLSTTLLELDHCAGMNLITMTVTVSSETLIKLNISSGKHVHELYTPLNPTNSGMQGMPNFLIFDRKHTLWPRFVGTRQNHLGEVILMCTHYVCFERKYKENPKFSIFVFFLLKRISLYCRGKFS